MLEAHLSEQANPERGLLSAGRSQFCPCPGSHHAVLIRGAEVRKALPFEVADYDGSAIQKRSFKVGVGR